MQRPVVRPHVEEMESRLVPSGAPLSHPGLGAALVADGATLAPALGGTVTGTYAAAAHPDRGTTYDLNGSGTLNLLGQVTAQGTLQSLGFIAAGHAGGTVTVKAGKDTITLQLTGPNQKGFAPLPKHFRYKVTGASGQFASLMGQHGTADLTLTPPSGATGSFTLTLHPKLR